MHPVLFHLGSLPIYAYGLMLALSLLLGWQLTVRFATTREQLPEEPVSNASLIAAVAGLLGARVLYVLVNPTLMEEGHAQWYELTSGGSMGFGGFFTGAAAVALYARWKRISFGALADSAAPALALGLVLTRIGCYLYGCDFGTVLSEDAPSWLQSLGTFPRWTGDDALHGSPALFHHLDRYALDREATHSLPVHPTQLYEAALGVVLLALTLVLWRVRRFRGQVISVLGMSYAVARYLLESLRDEPDKGELVGFSVSQLLALLLFAVCAVAYAGGAGRARSAAQS